LSLQINLQPAIRYLPFACFLICLNSET